jgi:filamentous hemagglutinin
LMVYSGVGLVKSGVQVAARVLHRALLNDIAAQGTLAVGKAIPGAAGARLTTANVVRVEIATGPALAEAATQAAARVAELRAALPAGSRGRVTLAVGIGRTAEGRQVTVIGTSEPAGYMRPGVTLKGEEVLATGSGHAEENVINYMQSNGISPLTIGASRGICTSCATDMGWTPALPATQLKYPH